MEDLPINADWPQLEAFVQEVNAENRNGSDRAMVLVCSSMAEELLKRLIRAFVWRETSNEDLFDARGAPFGAFSSRITGAYALGLISDSERFRLTQLRKLRNEMAHRTGVDLSKSPLREFAQNIHMMQGFPEGVSAKGKLGLSVIMLLGSLARRIPTARSHQLSAMEIPPPDIVF